MFKRRRVFLNSKISASVSGLAAQPRGLREKIWTVSQSSSRDLINAFCKPPAIGAWKPILGCLDIRASGENKPRISAAQSRIKDKSTRAKYIRFAVYLFIANLCLFHDSEHVTAKDFFDV